MPLDVQALRAGSRARAALRPRGPEQFAVRDTEIPGAAPGVRARHYRPVEEPRPLLVYLHGGFWLLGDLETHDRLCRRIARHAGVEVLAVDYRLAPEHPWPAAVDDAVAAVRWAAAELAEVVGVGGDSAGGCVAALTCLRLRDEPGTAVLPSAQVLVCPNTDLTGAQPSMTEKATGFGLEAADVRMAAAGWLPDVARQADGDVSPLHARSLAGLPPAVVVTAEHDPLRDEGDAYAARLRDAGVPVTHRREPGLPHGFVQGMELERADAAAAADRLFADAGRVLRSS